MDTLDVAYLHRPELAITEAGVRSAIAASNSGAAKMHLYNLVTSDVIGDDSHTDAQQSVDLVLSSAITMRSHDLNVASSRFANTPIIAIAGMQTYQECEAIVGASACRGVITLQDFNVSNLVNVMNSVTLSSERILSSEHPILEIEKGKYTVPKHPIQKLSPIQRTIFDYLVAGFSVKEIASRIGKSEKAVDSLKYRMFSLLDIHDRVDLALWAQSHDLGADLSVYQTAGTAPRPRPVRQHSAESRDSGTTSPHPLA